MKKLIAILLLCLIAPAHALGVKLDDKERVEGVEFNRALLSWAASRWMKI